MRAWKLSLPEARATGGGKSASAPQPGLTYFLYDGETLLMEMDSLGNATAVNTWGPNGLVSRRTGSSSVWYHYDERGCTVQRTNHLDQVIDSYQTDAYGQVSPAPTVSDPYIGLSAQWGYYRDPETGFQLCTYRYYDPVEGRWLTQDPIGMSGGLNLYGYCGGNPVGWSDPLGLDHRDAVSVVHGNRRIIQKAAALFGLQPELVGGVMYVEAYAGGVPGWNSVNQILSSIKYEHGIPASLGVMQVRFQPEDRLVDRLEFLTSFNACIESQVMAGANHLSGIVHAANNLGRKNRRLTNLEMAIIATEYNQGNRGTALAKAQPSDYGLSFLKFLPRVRRLLGDK